MEHSTRLMALPLLAALLFLAGAAGAEAQVPDTIYVSNLYTTHLVFPTDLIYTDLSNHEDLSAGVIEESKNALRIRARRPYTSRTSLYCQESNGVIHSYMVVFREHPRTLIHDYRDSYASSKIDTISVSHEMHTHIIFPTDLVYADNSNLSKIAASIVEQTRNNFKVRALAPFEGTANVTVKETNGTFHTFVLGYSASPSRIVHDMRGASVKEPVQDADTLSAVSGARRQGRRAQRQSRPSPDYMSMQESTGRGDYVSSLRRQDAPLLQDVIRYPREKFHLTDRSMKITFSCDNIIAYSDITYVVLSLENNSGVSYETRDAVFVVEDVVKGRHKVQPEPTFILPRNRYGTLTAAPGTSSSIVYSLDKVTLAKGQRMLIHLYEKGGQRNLTLILTPTDVNLAAPPAGIR